MAANPKLQSIAVTPSGKSISVGQKQTFTATGTFSNGSTQVLGPAISELAPGFRDTCVLLTSRGVECWGHNAEGELGDGTTGNDSRVAHPVSGIRTATAVAVGGFHGCALLASGAIRCWGLNSYGQLGNGTTNNIATTPVAVTGISTATALDLGYWHSCALLASGHIQCWGSGYLGVLGNGSAANSSIPVTVTGISTATAVGAGQDTSCALLTSGAVQCWGSNYYGGLGNGTNTDSNTPVTVSGISNATAIAVGADSACALLASGEVRCWGLNEVGTLGSGTNSNSNIPVPVTGIGTAVAITAGQLHYCAILHSGSVLCWGGNSNGELGNGTTTDSNIPVRVSTISTPTRLAAGLFHTCALFAGGAMKCWGWNHNAQLGNGQKTDAPNPLAATVVGTPGVVWTSSNSTKATITDRGVATGRAIGNTTISATTAGFINANAVLTVK